MSVPGRSSDSTPYFKIEFLTDVTGLRLSGEADLCAADSVRSAIKALPAGRAAIHLQLAELSFIDVRNAGRLVALTSRPAQPWLVLHYPPPMLAKMIALLWPEAARQCVIAAKRTPATTLSPDRRLASPTARS